MLNVTARVLFFCLERILTLETFSTQLCSFFCLCVKQRGIFVNLLLNMLGILPCRCLGSDGGTPWRSSWQDRHLDAILGTWLPLQERIQEIARATFGAPSVPKKLAQIPQIAYMALVQIVAEGQTTSQRHPHRGWNRCKCLFLCYIYLFSEVISMTAYFLKLRGNTVVSSPKRFIFVILLVGYKYRAEWFHLQFPENKQS